MFFARLAAASRTAAIASLHLRSAAPSRASVSVRAFSASANRSKTMTQSVKDTADSVNKKVGQTIASAIDKGEEATAKTKEAAAKTKEGARQTAAEGRAQADKSKEKASEKADEAAQKMKQ